MRKKFLYMICIMISLLISISSISIVGFAADSDATKIMVNGSLQNFETKAIIINGRTLVDMNDIFNSLKMDFKYDNETKTLTSNTEDYNIALTIDSEEASGTRKTYTLDVVPQIIGEKVMVPLRFVAEQLGYKVGWIDETQTVMLDI